MFDKLKNLFVVTDPQNKTKDVTSETQKSSQVKSDNESEGNQVPIYSPSKTAKADPKSQSKFLKLLLKAIENNNMEGFDYLEYKQSVKSLGNVQMDEQTRYASAMAMAKTMGAKPENLLKSALHYVNVLSDERNKFIQAAGIRRKNDIGGRQSEISQLKNKVLANTKQIEKLKNEITSSEKRLNTLESEMENAGSKIDNTVATFNLAYDNLVDQIKTDMEKMKQIK